MLTIAIQLSLLGFASYGIALTIAEEANARRPHIIANVVAALAIAATAATIIATGGPGAE